MGTWNEVCNALEDSHTHTCVNYPGNWSDKAAGKSMKEFSGRQQSRKILRMYQELKTFGVTVLPED